MMLIMNWMIAVGWMIKIIAYSNHFHSTLSLIEQMVSFLLYMIRRRAGNSVGHDYNDDELWWSWSWRWIYKSILLYMIRRREGKSVGPLESSSAALDTWWSELNIHSQWIRHGSNKIYQKNSNTKHKLYMIIITRPPSASTIFHDMIWFRSW